MTALKDRLYSVYASVGMDAKDAGRALVRPARPALTSLQKRMVNDLRLTGYAVVPNYWTRERALAVKEQVEALLEGGIDVDYESGAWLRFWDGRGHDSGVRRLYHVDKVTHELGEMRRDPFVLDVAAAYYGVPMYSQCLMFQHNTATNHDTRTYHVDAFNRQFKSFLYLDDVDPGNGPFAYIPGSHKMHGKRLWKQFRGNPGDESPTTFFGAELGELTEVETAICGDAGTLIVADVRGLHRGTPQVDRSRSVLVNYIYRFDSELQMDR
jgi:hypothetical protein